MANPEARASCTISWQIQTCLHSIQIVILKCCFFHSPWSAESNYHPRCLSYEHRVRWNESNPLTSWCCLLCSMIMNMMKMVNESFWEKELTALYMQDEIWAIKSELLLKKSQRETTGIVTVADPKCYALHNPSVTWSASLLIKEHLSYKVANKWPVCGI